MELSPKGNLKKFLQEQGHQILAEHVIKLKCLKLVFHELLQITVCTKTL